MADDNKGGIAAALSDMSMETRLLLAFVLMGVVMFVTPYFFPSAPPPKKAPDKPAAAQSAPVAAPVLAEAPVAGAVAASNEETPVIDTDLYRVEFSNRGAVVRSWKLKRYTDHSGGPTELVYVGAAPKVGFPFALSFRDRKPSTDPNQALFAVRKAEDGLGLDFEFSDGKVSVRKSFRFQKDKYLSEVRSEVIEGGVSIPHGLTWRAGFGDHTVPAAAPLQHAIFYDADAAKLHTNDHKHASDGVTTDSGKYSFAGLEDTYFAAVFLSDTTLAVQTFSDMLKAASENDEVSHVGAAVGAASGPNRLSLFVGPKDLDILRSVNPKLEQVVNWGWFGFIAKPIFLMVHWLNDRYIHNYGWSIIIVTLFINMATFPLKITSLRSAKRMQDLQPQIKAINEKFKNLSMRDPKRNQQNQEIMALYQKHGVNPLGGCVPLLLQLPFLWAFYQVFTLAIEMRGAEWLWVKDLSQPETIPIRLLPIAMIATQFWLQKMTPAAGADPAQQRMMLFMPLIFGFMFYGASSGLMLYWLTGNLVAIGQQWFFNKTVHGDVVIAASAGTKKPSRK
ncbi:MAG: membrane protein insertase YidC [Bryobacteraceae bacterium]